MSEKNILNSKDQARVDAYLSRPNHQIERKPFRPWLLMGVVVLVMIFLSIFSYILAYIHGVI
jgi:quinol-cytochrome oxidoreductase complex cytochrome b subunit